MRRVRPALTGVALAGALGLAACGGAPAPAPSPSAIPLTTVPPCASTVVVPAETLETAPDASQPPTVVLELGDAVSFPVAAGARVGVIPGPGGESEAQLCAAPKAPAGTATYVAQSLGYLRLGLQVGIAPAQRFFVRVTP